LDIEESTTSRQVLRLGEAAHSLVRGSLKPRPTVKSKSFADFDEAAKLASPRGQFAASNIAVRRL